jgi:hypothetical protein
MFCEKMFAHSSAILSCFLQSHQLPLGTASIPKVSYQRKPDEGVVWFLVLLIKRVLSSSLYVASYLVYSAGHFRKTYYADSQDFSYIFLDILVRSGLRLSHDRMSNVVSHQ